MKPIALSRLAGWCEARMRGADATVTAVTTDSRSAGRGALFAALRGERVDGHDFAPQVAAAGGAALLVQRELDSPLPQLVVPDVVVALGRIAAGLRSERTTTVLALTGSNGKTSVKTLLASILGRVASTHANPGNRNNEIGVPLAAIDAPEDADYAIYEMGAGKPGDIAYLTSVVRPDVSVVNNIAPAHLERMDSLFGVADTKAAIYDALPAGGTAVINADDAFAPYFAERAHGRQLLRFGIEASADITARDIRPDQDGTRFVLVAPQGEVEVALALPGRHNVRNALAAAALALSAGATLDAVREGLGAARPVEGRLVVRRLPAGATLVDDSYNANPGSLHAAIDLLAAGGDEGWLVLGDMRELGADAVALHAEAGRRAKAAGIARLYALGELSAHAAEAFGEHGRAFDGHEALAQALREDLTGRAGVRVLVKGSRGSRMDRIVDALLGDAGRTRGEGTDAA